MSFTGFLEVNIAFAVAAIIGVVALLVAFVLVAVVAASAVVDLRHDGFGNRKRKGGWGELGGSRCSGRLPCCCSLVGFCCCLYSTSSSCCWLRSAYAWQVLWGLCIPFAVFKGECFLPYSGKIICVLLPLRVLQSMIRLHVFCSTVAVLLPGKVGGCGWLYSSFLSQSQKRHQSHKGHKAKETNKDRKPNNGRKPQKPQKKRNQQSPKPQRSRRSQEAKKPKSQKHQNTLI